MARNDAGLLLVTSGVTGQLQNFSSQILQNSSHIDSSTDTNAVGVLSFLQIATSSGNRELQTSTEALGDLFGVLTTTALSASYKISTWITSVSIPFIHASSAILPREVRGTGLNFSSESRKLFFKVVARATAVLAALAGISFNNTMETLDFVCE